MSTLTGAVGSHEGSQPTNDLSNYIINSNKYNKNNNNDNNNNNNNNKCTWSPSICSRDTLSLSAV